MIAPSETTHSEIAEKHFEIDEILWRKIYFYILRKARCSPEDAEDLTQGVFHHLLRKGALDRFRCEANDEEHFLALLRTTAARFLMNQYAAGQAKKRRGWVNRTHLESAEFQRSAATATAPQASREARYLQLEKIASEAEAALGLEFRRRGKESLFRTIRPFLYRDTARIDYDDLAARSGFRKEMLRSTVYRARRRFREAFRERLSTA